LVVRGLDYASFKLLHLSILWRASCCQPSWGADGLRPWAKERLRKMLLDQDPGAEWEFPVIASAVDDQRGGIWESLVEPPYGIRLYGHHGFLTTYAGCHWSVLVSAHQCLEIADIRLSPSGSLPVVVGPPQTPRRHAMWKEIYDKYKASRQQATNNEST